jgi:hypothetical protein
VTLNDLLDLRRRRISFVVIDTETGADVTNVLLVDFEN